MLNRIDHVNIVVQDLEAMVRFYVEVLGLKQTKRVTISGEWVSSVVGLKGVQADVVYLDLPEGPRIELIRYHHPRELRPSGIDKANAPGLRHLALAVDDIDAIVRRLDASGVKFLSAVNKVPETQVTYASGIRKRLVYFQDPEGNLLELCEYH